MRLVDNRAVEEQLRYTCGVCAHGTGTSNRNCVWLWKNKFIVLLYKLCVCTMDLIHTHVWEIYSQQGRETNEKLSNKIIWNNQNEHQPTGYGMPG